MYCESCLFLSVFLFFFVFSPLAKKFQTTCSFTLHQSKVGPERKREREWTGKRDRVLVREVWRLNSHEIQPSNSYCCSKGRYIKYKTETGVSIYEPDYRCINQTCYLAHAVPSLGLLYGLPQIDGWSIHTPTTSKLLMDKLHRTLTVLLII